MAEDLQEKSGHNNEQKKEQSLKTEHNPEQKKEQSLKEQPKEQKPKTKFFSSDWYDKNYKKIMLLAFLLFLFSLSYIVIFYVHHNDIMLKDVTLTGGTSITVYAENININELSSFLKSKLTEDADVRKLEDIATRTSFAFVVESVADADKLKAVLEEYLGYKLNSENSSTEISGSALGKAFYNQLLIALAIAFLFMSITVFIIFKTPIPSLAVIFAAATDILTSLAVVDMLGIHVSAAGIAAFLMLIGYSVDTDIMLTTKVIKRKGEGTLNSRIKSAFKTGIIMTLTSLVAVLIGYFVAQADILKEIFLILSIGLAADILSTWLGNAAIIKWWCEKKKIN